MSNIGFWCTADRGSHYFNLNSGGVRALTFLQRLKLSPRSISSTTTISNKDAGGSIFVVPVVASMAWNISNSNAKSFISTKKITINESNVTVEFTSAFKNESSPISGDSWYYYDVYQSIDSGDSAGLYLFDGSGFSGITDVLKAGYCVYKATVHVADGGGWTVPDTVPARQNCTVFANWSSDDAVIAYDNISKTLSVDGAGVTLNLAVFSNGFNLEMPGAGFYVFNKQTNQCVYNSNYTPLFVKKTISFNESTVDSSIAKPMIALSSLGMGGDKRGEYYQLYNKGLKMSGSYIGSGRGRNTQYVYTQGFLQGITNSSFPLLVCDGSQYFN